MAVNFSLLDSRAPEEIKPFQMNTPAENQAIRYDMEGRKLDVAQKQQTFDQGNADRRVLQDALSQDGIDMATPDGNQKLLQAVKGKVSPDVYAKLADHADKIVNTHLTMQKQLLELPSAQTKAFTDQMETVVPLLTDLDKEYDKVKTEKGQQAAEAMMKEKIGPIMAKAQGIINPATGKPMYPPDLLAQLQQMPADMIHGIVAGSAYITNQAKMAHTTAQTREFESAAANQQAQAQAIQGGPGKGTVPYTDTADNSQWFENATTGRVFRKDPVSGKLEEKPALPRTAQKSGSSMLQKAENEGKLALTDSENDAIAEYSKVYGKPPVPPSLGAGNTAGRVAYLKRWVAGLQSGEGATAEGKRALERDATRAGLSMTIKQAAATESTTADIKKTLPLIQTELEKLGGPDSPIVRRYWNSGLTEIEGDPRFTALNGYIANLKEQTARLLSRNTGASGTPVAFLKVADQFVNGSMNLQQFIENRKTIENLADISLKSSNQEVDSLLNRVAGPDSPSSKVSAKDQSTRDTEKNRILREELDAEKEALSKMDPKDTAAIARKKAEIAALEKEMGGKREDKKSKFTTSNW